MYGDEDLTLGAYLSEWIRTKEESLKPTTFVRYRDYVRSDLIPSFGGVAVQDLRPRHIVAWQEAELARGRGAQPSTG
ncbi:N-terminal phage integrase SAM-like domain-containing protein [Streptomyces sp. Ag109_O5-1]|uniref:N-terminal phage integrase SAM-like domain-containing protein n=1 Tax=Streptomyces sp. Ag109_O5-1 TaxID=1938851 RepID=UPI0037DA44CC